MALLIGVLSIVATAVFLLFVFVLFRFYPEGIEIEIAKALLNLLTVVIVTQAGAIAFSYYQQAKRKTELNDAARLRILECLTHQFGEAKKMRRKIRSQLVSSGDAADGKRNCITSKAYAKSLNQINNIQITIEAVTKDVENSGYLFPDSKKVFDAISEMESYLNKLVNEWEHNSATFSGTPKSAQTNQFPKLLDFIGPYDDSKFRTDFVHQFYQAADDMRAALSDGQSTAWKLKKQKEEGTAA